MPISNEHLSSASAGDATQEKGSPQPVARSPSSEASVAVKEAAAAELSGALAAVSLKEAVAAPVAASAAPASSTIVAAAVAAPVTASGAAVPVVPSSLDEPVKDVNGELINGGFKRGGAENGPDGVYDEVELEDMEYDESLDEYSYPCPCGDRFRIRKDDMLDGEDIARCASCSLLLRVIYDPEDLEEED